MGANDVGVYKGIRAVDGAVNVGFGRKVHYGVYLLLLQQFQYEVVIPDIAMHKSKSGMILHRRKIGFIACIGQGIEHCYPVIRIVLNPVVDKIGTYETSTAGY